MTIRLRAEDVPESSRYEYWQHIFETVTVPYQLRGTGANFRSRIHASEFGMARVLRLDAPPGEVVRTPQHIRRFDPDLCMIAMQLHGRSLWEQDGRECTLSPGDFTFIDLSRPNRCVMRSSGLATVRFPRPTLSLRSRVTATLTAVPVTAKDGSSAAMVSTLVGQITRQLDGFEPTSRTRIGSAVLDLLTAALATRLDRGSDAPALTRHHDLLLNIHAFVEQHLGEPSLSPSTIAAAHHISVRYLHKLFETQETTVAGWVRHRRLERCRRDLLDPAYQDRPVSAIGARWGFLDAVNFSRAFRAAYGDPPGEYRARTTSRHGVERQARGG